MSKRVFNLARVDPTKTTALRKRFRSAEEGGGAAYAKGGKNTAATGVKLNIVSKSARSVAKYSAYPREKEVIFPRNTSFVVGGLT